MYALEIFSGTAVLEFYRASVDGTRAILIVFMCLKFANIVVHYKIYECNEAYFAKRFQSRVWDV